MRPTRTDGRAQMLFNSLSFIFGFLPIALGGYWALANMRRLRLWFLLVVSIVFYGYWDPRFVPLLLATILFNWWAAGLFVRFRHRGIAVATIAANLLALGVYKYADFFTGTINSLLGVDLPQVGLVLPLGISFFTFHHIIYWADLIKGRAPRYGLRDYGLYIALFPQILAGPLVRHSEIVHQFALAPFRDGWAQRMAQGLCLLVIGLCKKVFVADAMAGMANPLFAKVAAAPLTVAEGWQAALAFTFQIYFDFSGYSDMAIGLSLMLGLVLPLNFDAPYRAVSIQDFWRRWHMTLSRFLRDFLYVPMGGNRHGLTRQLLALLATMALGGLWHGAGWTFVLWGVAHGLALAAHLLWRRLGGRMPAWGGWALTFVFVVVTWVLFRAGTVATAEGVLSAMAGQGAWGHFEGWRLFAVAALVAMAGPTSWQAVQALRPRGWIAAAAAVATIAVIFRLSDGAGYEFIYFQF
ncbi:MAG TPA: MBOAT family O-acyltransferase [Magnetospirillum sp.]|nr:MBOAT family O-acyltransferase [Magnetospirillum sp.]